MVSLHDSDSLGIKTLMRVHVGRLVVSLHDSDSLGVETLRRVNVRRVVVSCRRRLERPSMA